MKIAIGKFGKSIKFKSDTWGAVGGDNEAPILFENLIHQNPQHEFVLLGLSDYERLPLKDQQRLNKHNNIINPWANLNSWKKTQTNLSDDNVRQKYMEDVIIPNYPVDAALIIGGMMSSRNVMGHSRNSKDPSIMAKPLLMFGYYAGPIIHYLNITNTKWIMILNDPRSFPTGQVDLYNAPKKILSQYNEKLIWLHDTSYTDQTINKKEINSEYANVETTFLIDKERDKFNESSNSLEDLFGDTHDQTSKKAIKFMIVCNQGNPSRYPDLKKYILDHIQDVDIYGKWNENILNNDSRFKGPKKFNELQSMLPSVKYTFCIPIKKGWCTAKFYEMAHYGIIPFLHPTYDEQNNLKCPEILRVKDSADLFQKIEYLESDENAYNNLRTELDKLLKDEYYDGTFLNTRIMNCIINES